ncbi:MAG: hypothetical protein IH848_03405 [Acidobacteria bacterium]|nr:hypothetical protein [Acidobacteriota bacterium]
MKPFDNYPDDGRELLPQRKATNTRWEDGPELQRLTGQTSCAYCGVSLIDDYYHWLLLNIDHVIPEKECKRLSIPHEWCWSYSNSVSCCSGCNGFDNHFKIMSEEPTEDWNLSRFFDLRDHVFEIRKARIKKRREKEIRFFESRPWEDS